MVFGGNSGVRSARVPLPACPAVHNACGESTAGGTLSRQREHAHTARGQPTYPCTSGSERLPELEAVAFRVGGPAEAAVVVFLDPLLHGGPGGAKLGQHRIQIAHAV